MLGKDETYSPNGGEKQWFTMVESVNHHLKQIQVLADVASYQCFLAVHSLVLYGLHFQGSMNLRLCSKTIHCIRGFKLR